ncbi:MAG: hypothetical protein Crog4KO_31480 [Crocinitomicaceae bacterium]
MDYFANNPEWNQASSCFSDGCYDYQDFVYYINGDTVVNAQTYKKFYKRGQSNMSTGPTGPPCGPFTTYDDLAHLVRQDGSQIYLWNGVSDTLLYDYDIAIGDTFPVTYNVCDEYIVLDSIQTVMVAGQQRNRYFFTETTTTSWSSMTEGVGWPGGFFEPVCGSPGCGYQFACFRIDGQLIEGTNCFFEANINEILEAHISISPNPITNAFTISLSSERSVSALYLLEMNGARTKLSFTANNLEEVSGMLDQTSSGIYLMEVEFSDGQIARKKIIKE